MNIFLRQYRTMIVVQMRGKSVRMSLCGVALTESFREFCYSKDKFVKIC